MSQYCDDISGFQVGDYVQLLQPLYPSNIESTPVNSQRDLGMSMSPGVSLYMATRQRSRNIYHKGETGIIEAMGQNQYGQVIMNIRFHNTSNRVVSVPAYMVEKYVENISYCLSY